MIWFYAQSIWTYWRLLLIAKKSEFMHFYNTMDLMSFSTKSWLVHTKQIVPCQNYPSLASTFTDSQLNNHLSIDAALNMTRKASKNNAMWMWSVQQQGAIYRAVLTIMWTTTPQKRPGGWKTKENRKKARGCWREGEKLQERYAWSPDPRSAQLD